MKVVKVRGHFFHLPSSSPPFVILVLLSLLLLPHRGRGSVRKCYISLLPQCQENTPQGLAMLTWFYTICSTWFWYWGLCWALTLTNRSETSDLGFICSQTQVQARMQPKPHTTLHAPTLSAHRHKKQTTHLQMHTLLKKPQFSAFISVFNSTMQE